LNADKIYYNSRDIEFFPRGYFFGAPCMHQYTVPIAQTEANITNAWFMSFLC